MTERRRTGERRNHLMTDQEMAELVSVSVNTVRYWRQTGILPFVRVGKYPRIWYSEFERLFKKPLSHWVLTADTISSAESNIRRQL
jgi:excisionase family DNA binding protein